MNCIFSIYFKEIYTAWIQCEQRKGKSAPAQYYAVNLFDNLLNTLANLQQQTWCQGYFIAHYLNALVCLQKGYQQRFLYPKKNRNSTLTLNPLKTEKNSSPPQNILSEHRLIA